MEYTLITPAGRVYTFFGLACAEIFQQAYGGVLITPQILVEQTVDAVAV